MTIQMQRILPVLVSILIIVAIAILRQYSKTFAAIVATMPVNITLGLWIVYGSEDNGLVKFAEGLLFGLPPTFVFIVVAWLAARAGWGLVPMIAAGYAAWGVALLASFVLRGMLMQ